MPTPSRIPVLRRRSCSEPATALATPTPTPAAAHSLFMTGQHVAVMAKLTALVNSLHTTVQEQAVRLDRLERRAARAPVCVPTASGCQAKTADGRACEGSLSKKEPRFVLAGGKQRFVCFNHRNVKIVLDELGADVPVDGQKLLTS